MKPGTCRICGLSIHPTRTICDLCQQIVKWTPSNVHVDYLNGYKVGHGEVDAPVNTSVFGDEWRMGYLDGQGDLEREA